MLRSPQVFRQHILKRFYLFIFRERGREGEREGEKHHCVIASHTPPTGDLAHKPSMYPDWELNQRPFGSQSSAQSTKPHQPGQQHILILRERWNLSSRGKGKQALTSVTQLVVILQSKELSVWFLGQGTCPHCGFIPQSRCVQHATNQCCSPSLSPSLPLSLKLINKIF